MIVTKTPYRISFFGGGTDYPGWYRENGGSVLSVTIDKYCYITCRYLPKFFDHKHRFVYSEIESVNEISQIRHPAIRGVLEWLQWDLGIELHHDGDLPARSGLGSSSAFTVGLLNTLYAMRGQRRSKHQLAVDAIHVEQNVIKEAVGSQDQIAAAYGGFNKIDFVADEEFVVNPIIVTKQRAQDFHHHLMLFYTGQSRIAAVVAKSKIDNIKSNSIALGTIQESVDLALQVLVNESLDICQLGYLMHDAWGRKKSLSTQVSTELIDWAYAAAIDAGALGGKILGAGGGGFLLFFVPPDKKQDVRSALGNFLEVPFNFEYDGSSVTIYQPTEIF